MQRLFSHPITLIAVTVIAGVFFVSLDKSAHKAQTSVATIQDLKQETDKLHLEVDDLTQKVQAADSPLSKEKLIRDQLLMQKPGETVVQLPSIQDNKEASPAKAEEKTPWEEWKVVLSL